MPGLCLLLRSLAARAFATACITSVFSADAAEQSVYPARPVRLIVPFAPAGSADALARTLQASFSEALGQPVVIDNRPGASSTIGT